MSIIQQSAGSISLPGPAIRIETPTGLTLLREGHDAPPVLGEDTDAVLSIENLVTGVEVTELYVPDSIVVLAPGQEWRTVWESAIRWNDYEEKRLRSPQLNLRELGTVFVGDITYEDLNRGSQRSRWNPVCAFYGF
ncbi:hypothetical protein M1247_33650 [Mycobacterium sp. 21AC1]|uniref:hypothetical protein n=1 Tax=[Mycobacterium] appelbergii TaxID=2939269 RepID=UPI0029393054|nr:hypothetical protein [Mycobacterium sp. 21AC1]MDV3129890.1 hypothetical protein [Mycobacterium sp. 21AC1]